MEEWQRILIERPPRGAGVYTPDEWRDIVLTELFPPRKGPPNMKGSEWTDEMKANLSRILRERQINKGVPKSADHRAQISTFWKGRPKTQHFRNNLKLVVKGRVHITDGTVNRFVHEVDIPLEGWRRGRVVNRKKHDVQRQVHTQESIEVQG